MGRIIRASRAAEEQQRASIQQKVQNVLGRKGVVDAQLDKVGNTWLHLTVANQLYDETVALIAAGANLTRR